MTMAKSESNLSPAKMAEEITDYLKYHINSTINHFSYPDKNINNIYFPNIDQARSFNISQNIRTDIERGGQDQVSSHQYKVSVSDTDISKVHSDLQNLFESFLAEENSSTILIEGNKIYDILIANSGYDKEKGIQRININGKIYDVITFDDLSKAQELEEKLQTYSPYKIKDTKLVADIKNKLVDDHFVALSAQEIIELTSNEKMRNAAPKLEPKIHPIKENLNSIFKHLRIKRLSIRGTDNISSVIMWNNSYDDDAKKEAETIRNLLATHKIEHTNIEYTNEYSSIEINYDQVEKLYNAIFPKQQESGPEPTENISTTLPPPAQVQQTANPGPSIEEAGLGLIKWLEMQGPLYSCTIQ